MSTVPGSDHSATDPAELTRDNVAELLGIDPQIDQEEFVALLVKTFGIRRAARYDSVHKDDTGWEHRLWRVTLQNHYTGRHTRTTYRTGMGIDGQPDASGVLYSLVLDANAFGDTGTFEGFCAEFGYDTDSRRAEKMFKACGRTFDRLQVFLGDKFELFMYGPEVD